VTSRPAAPLLEEPVLAQPAIPADAIAAPRSARARHLLAGARAMAPWLLGVVPFGLVIGVSAARADIPTVAGWLTGPLIYAGSAQVAAIELLDAGAAPVVVVLAVVAINLRLVLYSATMATHWAGAPAGWQALGALLLIDPSFAVGAEAYEQEPDRSSAHLRYAGGAVVLWAAWLLAIGIGASAGTGLPAGLRLDLVIPLFLVGELAHRLDDRTMRQAAGVAAAVAIAAATAPLHLGPLLAMIAGIAVATRTAGRLA
jgi:predicted branched-subunit amino acid permease